MLTNGRTVLCGTEWCDGSVHNDACPGGACAPDCPTAFACCGADGAVCRARCCTGEVGCCECGGQFFCARARAGGACATDNDCFQRGACRAGRCCALRQGPCATAADCCTAGAACAAGRCSA